jgi:hypothetical protein
LKRLGCDVTVIDPSGEARARAAEHGAERILPSMRDCPEADGFVVATPTALHAETVGDLSNLTGRFLSKSLLLTPLPWPATWLQEPVNASS